MNCWSAWSLVDAQICPPASRLATRHSTDIVELHRPASLRLFPTRPELNADTSIRVMRLGKTEHRGLEQAGGDRIWRQITIRTRVQPNKYPILCSGWERFLSIVMRRCVGAYRRIASQQVHQRRRGKLAFTAV